MMFDAPAARSRDDFVDGSDDERQGEKCTRHMGMEEDSESPLSAWIRCRVR